MPKVNVYLPDELAQAVKDAGISVSPVCQRALEEEVERVKLKEQLESRMERLEVELWGSEDRPYTVAFNGYWLLDPNEEARTAEDGYDAGAAFGIALTGKGDIAVYTFHVNAGRAPHLETYKSLHDAEDDVPGDILAQAAGELGEDYVFELDI